MLTIIIPRAEDGIYAEAVKKAIDVIKANMGSKKDPVHLYWLPGFSTRGLDRNEVTVITDLDEIAQEEMLAYFGKQGIDGPFHFCMSSHLRTRALSDEAIEGMKERRHLALNPHLKYLKKPRKGRD